ncbi:MAG TPA: hypothetical protein VG649_16175 [Candidatus Angelobacter sp.]|nr:hypothetical protein [Candidatus Angelobacter sp.]
MAGQFNLFLSNVWEEFPWHRDLKDEIKKEFGGYWKVLNVDQSSSAPLPHFLDGMVSLTHLFIGIVGRRYGTCPPKSLHSFTELEYHTFAEFLHHPSIREYHGFEYKSRKYKDEKEVFCRQCRQLQFRNHLHAKHTLKPVRTKKELYSSVKSVLTDYLQRYSSSARNWFYCNCGHRIDPTFQGRVQERIDLSRWLESDSCQVLACLGEASIGKSALAWLWMQRDVRDELAPWLPPDTKEVRDQCQMQEPVEGVFWWSFSQNSGFEEFINRLFVTGRIFLHKKDTQDILDGASDEQKLEYIFRLLKKWRLLLVLDGFELQLIYKETTERAEMKTGDGRSCTNQLASAFIKKAAMEVMRSRVLLTAQCLPKELDDDNQCRKLWLRPVNEEIALRVGSKTPAFDNSQYGASLSADARLGAISAQKLEMILHERPNLDPQILHPGYSIERFIDPRKIQWVMQAHQRVKQILGEYRIRDDFKISHSDKDRRRYLDGEAVEYTDQMVVMEDMFSNIALQRLYPSLRLDISRLPRKQQQSGFTLGGKQAELELLSALLSNRAIPRLDSEAIRFFATILSEVADNHAIMIPPVVAAMRHQAVDPVYEGLGEEKNFAAIAIQQLKMGKFGSARQSLSREIELCREIGDTDRERAGNLVLRVMKDGGDFLDRMNFRVHTFSNERSSFLRNVYDAMYAKKIGEKRSALRFARMALYHTRTTEDARDKICANWLVGESLLEALSIDNSEPVRNYILKEVQRHLDQAQTDAQQNQLTDYQADTLLSLARWHRANAKIQEARDCCDEALHIAEDHGYRLKKADICNFIGHLELDNGRPKQAMKWAERAKKLAFWNHPTDQYMPAITEAEKLLKECRI